MADNFNVGTLGEMSARVTRWARERVDTDMVNDAINDAIQSLWKSASLATLSRFISTAVNLTIPSEATSVPVISISDPTDPANTATVAGGAFGARQASFTYSYVTDSGSETMAAPEVVTPAAAAFLYTCGPPAPRVGPIGWNLYSGAQGRLARQNVAPLAFNQTWFEPPAGMLVSPNGPYVPYANTTGDNISSIVRLDVANLDGTLSTQYQCDMASALFSASSVRLPSTTTYVQHAYDLVDSNRIEIRPASQSPLDATLFYMVRPRRLRWPQSVLPYSAFDAQQFIGQQALSDILLGLYEDDAAEAWQTKADHERQRITLQLAGEMWGKNKRVRRYM